MTEVSRSPAQSEKFQASSIGAAAAVAPNPVGGRKRRGSHHHQHKDEDKEPPTKQLRRQSHSHRRSFGGGGAVLNFKDPLNLNSVAPATGNTPPYAGQGPLTADKKASQPIAVIIPRNARDPLNLLSGRPTGDEESARRHHHRHPRRRRRHDPQRKSTCCLSGSLSDSELLISQSGSNKIGLSKAELLSPLAKMGKPQSSRKSVGGATQLFGPTSPIKLGQRRRLRSTGPGQERDFSPEKKAPKQQVEQQQSPQQAQKTEARVPSAEAPKGPKKDKSRFRYGNYNRYYGKRLAEKEGDPRLELIEKAWIDGKKVLDVGCNVGHVTLCLARDFAPKLICGIDIDGNLIGIARKNVRHYVDKLKEKEGPSKYPPSFSRQYGPLSATLAPSVGHDAADEPSSTSTSTTCSASASTSRQTRFPDNVVFRAENFVPQDDEFLQTVKPRWDTVLALSITKWVHLNWGDGGLKRFFRRIFNCLQPGGRLILEPQEWNSYKKYKAVTAEVFENYQKIRFKPDRFTDYLLSAEVGFTTCHIAGTPKGNTPGFKRPVQVFVKAEEKTRQTSL